MAEELLTEIDVEISQVYDGPSGTHPKQGPWEIYNFYIKDDKRKFTWFKTDKKPFLPVKGMVIKVMDYKEEETEGKDGNLYTNYNVSRIVLQEKQPETIEPSGLKKHTPQKSGRDSSLTMYISYAKDIVVAIMGINHDAFKGLSVNQITDMVVDEGVRMYDKAQGEPVVETEKATPEQRQDLDDQADYNDQQPPLSSYESDDIPF